MKSENSISFLESELGNCENNLNCSIQFLKERLDTKNPNDAISLVNDEIETLKNLSLAIIDIKNAIKILQRQK